MSVHLPDPAAYAALPDELFVIHEDNADAEEIARPSTTYWRDVWQRFRRDRLALVGLAVIVVMTVLCIVMPMVSPYSLSLIHI